VADKKRYIGVDVLSAAQERLRWVFEKFPRIYLSFSAGKDSTALLHLAGEEARRTGRTFGVLLVDLEAQYKETIEHAEAMFEEYSDVVEPYWVALPLSLRNAVSVYEPKWVCWDHDQQSRWVRTPPRYAITDEDHFPFFERSMEFEDLTEQFADWYSGGEPTACLVAIRTDESLNRFRAIAGRNDQIDGVPWTTRKGGTVYNAYPIYDWRTRDIWIYHNKSGKPYNHIYDLMHQAGLSPDQMRICQPYGDDQRKGLWLFQVLEPETWGKVVARVNGANSGALFARERGNINGTIKVDKPEGHTWQSFSELLLESMPAASQEHYRNKIAIFLKWWADRGYSNGIPDEADAEQEKSKKAPSWRRICKALLKNDYWCKELSFSQQKASYYDKYMKIMKKRRKEWGMA